MYEKFFGLKEKPFNLTPDPQFLYLSPEHKKAMACLSYAVYGKQGFVQLTGEVGSGKTTLLRAFLRSFDGQIQSSYVVNTSNTFLQLLRTILVDLGVPHCDRRDQKEHLLRKLRLYLKDQLAAARPVVIVFDEAQNLDIEVLEEIRMLSNLETEKQKLVQIILAGQTELRDKLDRPELRQLKQRVSVRCHLSPLDRAGTQAYIGHRLAVAGASPEIGFTEQAHDAIFRYSKGIPRLINVLCDAVLLAGYAEDTKLFDETIVCEVVSEALDGFVPRTRLVHENDILTGLRVTSSREQGSQVRAFQVRAGLIRDAARAAQDTLTVSRSSN